MLRMKLNLKFFALSLGVVINNDLERAKNSHCTGSLGIEVVSYASFKQAVINHAVRLGNTYPVNEIPYGGGTVATPSHAAKSNHSRIIPSGNNSLVNHFEKLSLARYTIVDIKTGKLNLSRRLFKTDLLNNPVVKRSVIFKLKRTKRECYALLGIRKRMSKIIHRIDAPLVACLMMRNMRNSVNNRVTHIEVRR